MADGDGRFQFSSSILFFVRLSKPVLAVRPSPVIFVLPQNTVRCNGTVGYELTETYTLRQLRFFIIISFVKNKQHKQTTTNNNKQQLRTTIDNNNKMASTTKNTSKKRGSDKDEFEGLRKYILDCPLFSGSPEHPAVKAALAGLDKELKQRERDAKLQKKFAQSASVTTASSTPAATSNPSFGLGDSDEWQQVAAEDRQSSPVNANRGDTDIQDEEDEVEIINMEGESSFFGKQLSELAIASIADSQARVRSPIAAVALACHAAMRSNVLGFACTGVTDDSNKAKCNGFAAPVRELPKKCFLPKDWDKDATSSDSAQQTVTLRYRKAGTGSVLLKVDLVESSSAGATSKEVSINLIPCNTQEPPSQPLVFPLESHINLDSWTAALRASASNIGIQPALHYKGLPTLLTSFAKTFDLGNVSDDQSAPDGHQSYAPAVQTIRQPRNDAFDNGSRNGFAPPIVSGPARVYDERNPTIGTAFPPHRPTYVGDFSGDLNGPGFANDPLRVPGSGRAGNLMGPNHPMFQGGGISGIDERSGFGMRPRFDPFGPPGGPQEIYPDPTPGANGTPNPAQRRPPSGNPNPDHLQPPNSLGNNGMFS